MDIELKEIETNEELTDLEEIHFIEIPKLKKINYRKRYSRCIRGMGRVFKGS